MSTPIVWTSPHTAIFIGTVAIWILADARLAVKYRDGRASQDRGSRHLIGTMVALGVAGALVLPRIVPAPRLPFEAIAFWVGILIMLGGVTLRQYAAWKLRDAFSITVRVDSDQAVVDAGPYRLVRHPAYTGGYMTLLGAGVVLGNVLSLFVLASAGAIGYAYRIYVEEQALIETLGETYEEYTDDTPYRLVPGIW